MERVGVDIGGTGIKAARVDVVRGALVTERLRVDTPKARDPRSIAVAVAAHVEALGGDGTVGIGMPSVIAGGVARTAANIDPSWIGVDVVQLFSKATGRPCRVLNDADAAGIAEMTFGTGAGRHGVVLLLTLGTGIGSAVFVEGRLVPNTEFGHIEIRGKAGERRAAPSVMKAKDLNWKQWAARLNEYLGRIEQLVWPDVIILGGGITKNPEKFLPHLETRATLVIAEFRNSAGIVGAAMHAAAVDEAG